MSALAAFAVLAAISSPSVEMSQRCALPAGWKEMTRDNPRYIIFGETHGITEGPAFVGEIACALAAKGEQLLVALELSAPQNDALQTAWKAPHAQFAETLIRTMPDWERRNDGVTSEAMLALLVHLHALKEAGRAIDVVAFNGERDEAQKARFADLPMQGPHEAAQAENIRIAAGVESYDHVLVLVGNLHAQKRPAEMQGVAFKPMAMHLAPADQVLSLELIYGKGTGWNCQLREGATFTPGKPIDEADISCAAHPEAGREGFSGEPRVGEWHSDGQKEWDSAFDGYAWVGPAHASPPAAATTGPTK